MSVIRALLHHCIILYPILCRWNESIAAGQSRPKSAPAFRPRFCFLDKKVLRFYSYFEETAGKIFKVVAFSANNLSRDCQLILKHFFLVHYYISEERVDMVTQQFEEFNKNFREIESVFKEVTGVDFVFGQKFMDVDKQVRIYI